MDSKFIPRFFRLLTHALPANGCFHHWCIGIKIMFPIRDLDPDNKSQTVRGIHKKPGSWIILVSDQQCLSSAVVPKASHPINSVDSEQWVFLFPDYSLHSFISYLYTIYWAVGWGFSEADEMILLSGWGRKGQKTYANGEHGRILRRVGPVRRGLEWEARVRSVQVGNSQKGLLFGPGGSNWC